MKDKIVRLPTKGYADRPHPDAAKGIEIRKGKNRGKPQTDYAAHPELDPENALHEALGKAMNELLVERGKKPILP